MCLAQGPQRSDAGEARTHDPSVSSLYHFNKLQLQAMTLENVINYNYNFNYPNSVNSHY